MTEFKSTLLIVEDDPDVAEMLNTYFRVQGYEVNTANRGENAVKLCHKDRPDLVILDVRLPDIDGYEVLRRLRSDRRTGDIPVIFLTEKRGRLDKLQGLELGADDYLTKPFDIQELRLRVRNALRRLLPGSLNNPVTGLPEGVLVDERLAECLLEDGWALLLVSLLHLDVYSESYGFVASDDVLRAVGLMISNAVRELGGVNDFVGQIGPTDFLVVTSPPGIGALTERIQSRLSGALDYFYIRQDSGLDGSEPVRMEIQVSQLLAGQDAVEDLEGLKNLLFRRRI